ncbi:hypothetical protein RYH80_06045 [Halobaculum sp. MBLA0147]|uniref:hypothetical protein n=1 Tax=Halobaculum sp. MBLA0147 TaxID=3079934 RepID=UPI0035255565
METTWLADGLRVTDAAKNTVVVGLDGWDESVPAPSVAAALGAVDTGPEEPSSPVSGSVERIRYPPVASAVIDLADGARRDVLGEESVSVPPGPHLLRAEASVRVYVRFDGPATLSLERLRDPDTDRRFELRFAEPTPVSLAFGRGFDSTASTVTVPRTPEGVATALSVSAAAVETASPDRSWPTQRTRPPRVTFGETVSVPESLAVDRVQSEIRLVVPRDLRYLVTGASLAHYLGATVLAVPDADPRLVVGDHVEPLGEIDTFERRTTALLRRCFYLDCVARGAGPHGGPLAAAGTLDELGLDAERLYEAPLAERVRRYLAAPFETVTDEFPEWHLSVSVAPRYEHVPTLQALLPDLPHVFRPAGRELSETEWLELSVEDRLGRDRPTTGDTTALARGRTTDGGTGTLGRGVEVDDTETTTREVSNDDTETTTREVSNDDTETTTREVSNVELVRPRPRPGRTRGWLADGVPVGGFEIVPAAYENRAQYLDDGEGPLRVVAVLNDASMRAEHDRAVAHYESRADRLNADVTVRRNLSTAELARTFEAESDLLHFVGHRDEAGLACPDGHLATSSLSTSRARTFFLNACGSYPEGRTLIEKGSVAGGVTFERVLDDQAARVGTTFARLMVLGFSVQRGLDYARRQILTPRDYAVVGDGSHVVAQNDSLVPPRRWLFDDGDDRYRLLIDAAEIWAHGGESRSTLVDDDERYLYGRERVYTLEPATLDRYLATAEAPIVYDERLWWPADLRAELLDSG